MYSSVKVINVKREWTISGLFLRGMAELEEDLGFHGEKAQDRVNFDLFA